jgi:hypothetical protein
MQMADALDWNHFGPFLMEKGAAIAQSTAC